MRKNHNLVVLIGVVVVLIVALALVRVFWPADVDTAVIQSNAVAPKAQGDVKLGAIIPLTGDVSTIGQNMLDAMELAVEEINAEGGINGRTLKLIAEDGKCNGKEAASAAHKLVNLDKVQFIVGGACSSESGGVSPITDAAKILTLSPCSSNPDLTYAGDYFFRNYPSDSYAGVFAANYVSEQGIKKVALLSCLSDWCVGLKNVFKEQFVANGGQIVAEQEFEQGARDLRTQLLKIKESGAELIYFAAYTESSIAGFRQIKELGIDIPQLGGDTWDDPKIFEDAGTAGEGAMYVKLKTGQPNEFKAKMKAKTGTDEIQICVPQAYDAVKLAAQVMRQATTSEAMKDALYKADYDGVAGRVRYDRNGDLIGADYNVFKRMDGKAVAIA